MNAFLKYERSYQFYQMLPQSFRKKIRKHFGEVDPEGLREMDRRIKSARMKASHAARDRRRLPAPVIDMKEIAVAIELECLEYTDTTLVQFIPATGVKNVLAICLAAGYSKAEVAAMVDIDPSRLNALVSSRDVKAAAKLMPEAIAFLADGKVMRDLMKGEVSSETERADKISERRRKVHIEQRKEGREARKDHEELENRKEKQLAKRFGVDRKEGKVIDVEDETDKEDGT